MVLDLEADRHAATVLGNHAIHHVAIVVVVSGILLAIDATIHGHIRLVHRVRHVERIVATHVDPVVLARYGGDALGEGASVDALHALLREAHVDVGLCERIAIEVSLISG